MCIKRRVSCAHPNWVRADKAEIRIKFIPFIGPGLSQQDPRGLPVSFGLFYSPRATNIPISEGTLNVAHASAWVTPSISSPEVPEFLSCLVQNFVKVRFRETSLKNKKITLLLLGPWSGSWPGEGVCTGTDEMGGEAQPKTGSILQWQQEMQHRMTWWGSLLSSLEGFFPVPIALRQSLVTHFLALIDF